jgi:hypothetical protein
MNVIKILPVSLIGLACLAPAQQQAGKPDEKPNVYLQNNRPKNEKESNTRTIQGTVKDSSDNPIGNAIVQLKDTKTSNIVNFATKDDGKFAFRDLSMAIEYELLAKSGAAITPVKKVSVYDTRKNVVLNFQVTPAKP